MPSPKYQLINGNCLDVLPHLDPVKCIFADPFDNIGLGYDEYDDRMPDEDYVELLAQFVNQAVWRAEIVWFSFNAKWTFAMGRIFESVVNQFADSADPIEAKACTQVFTFGQHNKHDLGNNHRPLWRLKRKSATLYPDAIKVPSWRQRNGDKRAAAGGRVPGDVFDMQYPTLDTEESIQASCHAIAKVFGVGWASGARMAYDAMLKSRQINPGDVFDFPRVTGNSKQRCDWHPTQLHEELVERCIKLSTAETDAVIDLFGGTGTTLRVCQRLGRPCTLIELDRGYCERIAEANGLKVKSSKRWAA